MSGQIVSIHITPKAEADMAAVDAVRAVPGRGLEGDRYFEHTGTYSETPGTGRDITLIESEQIEVVEKELGVRLNPGDSRRNITTRGVSLNDLVDREFHVGEVLVRGMRLCEPCDYMQKRAGVDGLMKALVHRGGLRVEIIAGGTIRVGDEILTD
jgi:MOSC domain-containing protein YiiM